MALTSLDGVSGCTCRCRSVSGRRAGALLSMASFLGLNVLPAAPGAGSQVRGGLRGCSQAELGRLWPVLGGSLAPVQGTAAGGQHRASAGAAGSSSASRRRGAFPTGTPQSPSPGWGRQPRGVLGWRLRSTVSMSTSLQPPGDPPPRPPPRPHRSRLRLVLLLPPEPALRRGLSLGVRGSGEGLLQGHGQLKISIFILFLKIFCFIDSRDEGRTRERQRHQ